MVKRAALQAYNIAKVKPEDI